MFGWAMEGLFGFAGNKKKQPLIPLLGQELYSCDTTQIDVVKRPLASRAITRARWITGGSPSAATKKTLFRPPSEVHSHDRSPFRFHYPELAAGSHLSATTLPQRFVVIHLLLPLYTSVHRLSTLFFVAEIKFMA